MGAMAAGVRFVAERDAATVAGPILPYFVHSMWHIAARAEWWKEHRHDRVFKRVIDDVYIVALPEEEVERPEDAQQYADRWNLA